MPIESLNYFNYFTEVEEEFVRRRGKPLLVSPMDWALIESWKSAGIPLHIVLRAINSAFDAYDARKRKFRKINSVFYCQQEVESNFAQYQLSQVGASANQEAWAAESQTDEPHPLASPQPAFPKEVLVEFFARCSKELAEAEQAATDASQIEIKDAISRARARLRVIAKDIDNLTTADAQTLERDLDGLDRLLLQAILQREGEAGMQRLRDSAEAQMKPYRKKMEQSVYEQTITNFVSRNLREKYRLPRLSLFYL